MPNKELTDNEIIKALNTAFGIEHLKIYCANIENELHIVKVLDVIDLINRQKAEIERLCSVVDKTDAAYFQKVSEVDRAKSEAIKEFAERLKSRLIAITYMNFDGTIDNLVKEMVGDAE